MNPESRLPSAVSPVPDRTAGLPELIAAIVPSLARLKREPVAVLPQYRLPEPSYVRPLPTPVSPP